jgi:hypothetical protein
MWPRWHNAVRFAGTALVAIDFDYGANEHSLAGLGQVILLNVEAGDVGFSVARGGEEAQKPQVPAAHPAPILRG